MLPCLPHTCWLPSSPKSEERARARAQLPWERNLQQLAAAFGFGDVCFYSDLTFAASCTAFPFAFMIPSFPLKHI